MQESPLSACPVPREQQPVNEYEQLKEAPFFGWTILDPWAYGRKLFWAWAWGWAIAGPIAAASFPPAKELLRFFLCGAGGALALPILVLVRLYLGWVYVGDRLDRETIFYEESGWYDGQTWQKPPAVLARDRLISTYQVRPILDRLKRTLAGIALLLGVGTLTWQIF